MMAAMRAFVLLMAPPKRPAEAQPVENRVSVVPGDPNLAAATAAMHAHGLRQAEFAHQEWLARQHGYRTCAASRYGTRYTPHRAGCEKNIRVCP